MIGAAIAVALLSIPAPAHGAEPVNPCDKWVPLMREYRLPVKKFKAICYRESRGQARAIGWNYHAGTSYKNCSRAPAKEYRKCPAVRSFDLGIYQVNSTWVTVTSKVCKTKWGDLFVLLNPRCNHAVAAYLYHHGGGLANWRGTSGRK